MGRVPADRIGGRGVAREPQRLAAAAAEVDLLAAERAAPAGLLHPVGAAEARERIGLAPDPVQRVVADVGELEARDRRRGLARQHVAVRGDHHRRRAPAAHARLGQVLEVVGEHPEDVDLGADPLAEALDRLLRALQLLPRRHERLLVGDRPAVVLRVGQLEPLRAELERELEQLLDAIEVLAVQDAVDRQREVELLRVARGRDLLLEGPVAGDAVVVLGVRALDRDLHVVEPGRLERLGALAREERPGGDERRVQAGVARAGAQLDEIAAQHRLAARERELQDAERARLAERADPVLGLELVAVRLAADVERVRAVRAVQRALVGELGDQRGRPRRRHRPRVLSAPSRRPAPATSSRRSAPS